jgi:hypothetical protein
LSELPESSLRTERSLSPQPDHRVPSIEILFVFLSCLWPGVAPSRLKPHRYLFLERFSSKEIAESFKITTTSSTNIAATTQNYCFITVTRWLSVVSVLAKIIISSTMSLRPKLDAFKAGAPFVAPRLVLISRDLVFAPAYGITFFPD